MNTPIYNHDFVETAAAKIVDTVLEASGSSIIVLTGIIALLFDQYFQNLNK